MKYPKLFDGPSAVGEAGIRALERVDAPYLTHQGTDNTSLKQGLFRRVTVKAGTPWFWTEYATPDKFTALLLAPDEALAMSLKNNHAPFGHTPNVFATPFNVFVGADYILAYYRDQADSFDHDTHYWPTLERVGAPTPRISVATPALSRGKSIDLFPAVDINGLSEPLHSIGLFASGHDAAVNGFRYGVSYLTPADSGDPNNTKQSKMFVGDTKTRTIAEVFPPVYPGRDMDFYTPATVAKGKLQYLQCVKEKLDAFTGGVNVYKPKVEPFLAKSSDYGLTWSQEPATFLTPHLALTAFDYVSPHTDRDIYSNTQLDYLSLYGMTFYLGQGKVAVFIPNGMVPGETAPDVRARAYAPMLFVGDVHSAALTRVAWPADDWTTNIGGYTLVRDPVTWQVGWRRMAHLHGAHFSFGVGCLYVPIIPMTADVSPDSSNVTGWKIMVTRDFGATWTIVDAEVPDAVQHVGNGCFAGTVIRPYENAQKKGLLYFTGFDVTLGTFEVWATDGDFTNWKRVYAKAGADETDNMVQSGDPLFDSAFYGVLYGNKLHPSAVFPAFPGEFEA